MAEVGSAFVSVVPSAKGFGKKLDGDLGPQLDKSGKSGGARFGKSFGGSAKGLIAGALALATTGAAAGFLKGSIAEARESQKVGAQTRAVIKSTGGAANVTAKQFGQLSTAISNKVGIDDEAIQSGENVLATFTNIRNEVGKNNDIFTQATTAAVDLGVAMKLGPTQASLQLGKALNDPVKGMTRLQRVGVTFTDQQKKQVAQMVKVGDTAGAQKIILKELTREFGGSAKAQATSGEKAKVAYDNLKETIGTALLPVLDKFENKLTTDVIPAVSKFVTQMQDGTGEGGKVVSTFKSIVANIKPVVQFLGRLVQGFAGLPGSTQKLILLAGAALLVKNRFGESLPSLQNFSKASALATTKAVALRGGTLAAGIGLSALASKAGGTSTTLGKLATVGAGVATGFAVGGPWGAAIGGAAGLFSVLQHHTEGATGAETKFAAELGDVTGLLNAQTGALKRSAAAAISKKLSDGGAYDAARRMGISLRDVLLAAEGNAGALRRVNVATNSFNAALSDTAAHQAYAAKYSNILTGAVGGTNKQIVKARQGMIDEAQASGHLAKALQLIHSPKVDLDTRAFSASLRYVYASMKKIGNLSATAKANLHASDVGHNAQGTNNWRGGLTWVGEKGPELINLAKGAQVIPNNKIGEVGAPSPGFMGGGRMHPDDIKAIGQVILAGAAAVSGGVYASQNSLAATTGGQSWSS